jgi:hypothetical protein
MVAEQNGSRVADIRVGFLGLGIMGTGMARNLMKAGFASVTVWNRSSAKVGNSITLAATLWFTTDLPQQTSCFSLLRHSAMSSRLREPLWEKALCQLCNPATLCSQC